MKLIIIITRGRQHLFRRYKKRKNIFREDFQHRNEYELRHHCRRTESELNEYELRHYPHHPHPHPNCRRTERFEPTYIHTVM